MSRDPASQRIAAHTSLDALAGLPAATVDWVERLHEAVDSVLEPLAARLGSRLTCALGCTDCCIDDLTVFAVEAAVLVRHHRELFEGEPAHPSGACALLDASGACRAYADRPYVCRTQGLPLRWLAEDGDGEPIELRDECPLNGKAGPPLEELPAGDCFALGPFEERLAAAQARVDGGAGERVALRALFQRAQGDDAPKIRSS